MICYGIITTLKSSEIHRLVNYPRNPDYENPSNCNIVGGRNFSLEFMSVTDQQVIKLGIWHIIPYSLLPEVYASKNCECIWNDKLQDELKKTHDPVVMYCHGNSNHRGSPYRLHTYRVFQEMNFHIISFDYRGYGDSTRIRPTERGVVEDAFNVYSWLIKSLDSDNRPTVLIWGHSLGSAIAANMLANLNDLCDELGKERLPQPDGLVLEAPFNNLKDEIESHPLSKLVRWLPYFKGTFVKPFTISPEYAFTTDQYLPKVPDIPILMMHSKGDKIVPYDLAVKLHTAIKDSRRNSEGLLVFHTFDKSLGLGHNNLCEAHNLRDIVRNFLKLLKKA